MTNQDLHGRTIKVRNPRTGEMDYSFEVTENIEIKEIVSDLRSAQKAWADKTIDQRADTLNDWAKAVSSNEALLEALVQDTGRYFIATAEIARLTTMIGEWLTIGHDIFKDQPGIQSSAPTVTYQHQYKPFEVVGIIGPWNFPFLISDSDSSWKTVCFASWRGLTALGLPFLTENSSGKLTENYPKATSKPSKTPP